MDEWDPPIEPYDTYGPDEDPLIGKVADDVLERVAGARRPSHSELHSSWRRARELGLKFETTTFERLNTLGMPAIVFAEEIDGRSH